MILEKELHPINWIEPEPDDVQDIARDKVLAKQLIESITQNKSFTYLQLTKLICGWRKNARELEPFIAIKKALVRDQKLLEEEQAKAEPDAEIVSNLEAAIAVHEAGLEARRPLNIIDDQVAAVKAMIAGESVGGVPACKSLTPQEVVEIIEEVYQERVATYTFRE